MVLILLRTAQHAIHAFWKLIVHCMPNKITVYYIFKVISCFRWTRFWSKHEIDGKGTLPDSCNPALSVFTAFKAICVMDSGTSLSWLFYCSGLDCSVQLEIGSFSVLTLESQWLPEKDATSWISNYSCLLSLNPQLAIYSWTPYLLALFLEYNIHTRYRNRFPIRPLDSLFLLQNH